MLSRVYSFYLNRRKLSVHTVALGEGPMKVLILEVSMMAMFLF